MLIYSKKVDEKMKLFGTLNNIPSDEDELLTYTDGEGKAVEPALSLSQSFVDGGKHSIKRVEDGKEIKVFIGDVNVIPGDSSEPVPPTPVGNPYLTFSSEEPFTLSCPIGKLWDGTLEYSTDTENWTEWDGSEIESSSDNKLHLRGSGNTVITGDTGSSSTPHFELTGNNISCIGNIENLLDYQTVEDGEHPQMGFGCYGSMFYNCTSLITAPELPATTLTYSCYYNMFWNCTSLTTAPQLPATTLAERCYNNMFMDCTSLITPPSELPATTLAESCCVGMFYGCSSLAMLPELPATTLADYCCQGMFYDCSSIKLSTTQDADYTTPYRIPKEGTGIDANSALSDMFANTGGTFTGTPTINTTYYLHKDNHIV